MHVPTVADLNMLTRTLTTSCPQCMDGWHEPPISILAGEYGVWASESATQMEGNKGSLQYSIGGLDLNDPIILHWEIHIVEANTMNQRGRLRDLN